MALQTGGFNTEFRYQAIADTQGTIRAIDTKIGFLLLVLLVPFSVFGRIRFHIAHLLDPLCFNTCLIIEFIVILVFIISWLFSFAITLRALIAIDNPSKHIVNNDKCNSSFYLPGLFTFSFLDAFLNRNEITAKKDVDSLIQEAPNDDGSVYRALIFEQTKLVYIRDIKMHRQKWAFILAFIWLVSGFITYIFSICK